MRVQRLQHASVPRPPGQEAHQRAVSFYSGVLGLEEIPKPRTFENRIEVTWFRVGDGEIHIYAADSTDSRPRSGPHFCLVVDDLRSLRDRLEAGGFPCRDTTPIPNRPRFFTHDPFGNEIELASIEGDYLA